MHMIFDPSGRIYATMDNPPSASYDEVMRVLKFNFDYHYAKKLPYAWHGHPAQYL